ncbi:hypothetical protein PIROE2DRAFT_49229, partial [Piromyces sp. E2]
MIISNKFINIGYTDNTENGYGRTPLIYAVQRKNYELSKFLIRYNIVNVNLILHFIFNIKCKKQFCDEELNDLSKNCILKSDINYQDNNGNTALLYACKLNSKKIIELLLKNGADTNIVNHKNKSPLMYSCKNGNKNCVDMLLEYHAKLDIESNNSGKTAFKYACEKGNSSINKNESMSYLDINFKDKHGYTALMWASYLGHTEIVKELIQHHAN